MECAKAISINKIDFMTSILLRSAVLGFKFIIHVCAEQHLWLFGSFLVNLADF